MIALLSDVQLPLCLRPTAMLAKYIMRYFGPAQIVTI